MERGNTEADFVAEIGVPVEMLRLREAEMLSLDQAALTKLRHAGISADWLLFGDNSRARSAK